MAIESAIEWTNDTWNPWHGCIKVSPGCKFCYMYRDKKRWGQDAKVVVRAKRSTFLAPMKMLKGPLVFTCSWSDFFIDKADQWRDDAWNVIKHTPQLTYQILTKRPERIANHLPSDWESGWENVWLGVSVENNNELWRTEILREIPVLVRFISAEPLLDKIDLNLDKFSWVISGGESGVGKNWRPAKVEWFRSIRDQCQSSKVAYFHKQHGGNKKIDHAWGGRVLDGRTWDEFPIDVNKTNNSQVSPNELITA